MAQPIKPTHVFILLATFLFMWVTSEVLENVERKELIVEVEAFMHRGDRFTSKDGKRLQEQIDELRREHGAHMQHSATFTDMIINHEKRIEELEK